MRKSKRNMSVLRLNPVFIITTNERLTRTQYMHSKRFFLKKPRTHIKNNIAIFHNKTLLQHCYSAEIEAKTTLKLIFMITSQTHHQGLSKVEL